MIFILAGLLCVAVSCSSDKESEEDSKMMESEEEIIATTSIPDSAFEQLLIDLGFDDIPDGKVDTENIEGVVNLFAENSSISDLTGINAFKSLEGLYVENNLLSVLDLSSNIKLKFIFAKGNQLTSLNLSNLTILEKLDADNNQLTMLDISSNLSLQLLSLASNELEDIDISTILDVVQLNDFAIENNPLTCIKVNQDQLDNLPMQWTRDTEDTYALDCD
jgi:Leucine-rich repeat (LRR) protein